jgi:ribokinase
MITVFGSINIDLVCRTEHLPRPGETVHGSDYQLIPGGKGANQALAARRAGAAVRLVGAVGADNVASVALSQLSADGVDLSAVVEKGPTTGMAIITVDGQAENTIVLSPGANARLVAADFDSTTTGPGDTLLLQMEVPFEEGLAVAREARARGARVLLSVAPFRPVDRATLEAIDVVLVNETEARDLARHLGLLSDGDGAATVSTLAAALGRTIIATLGAEGAVAAHEGEQIRVPALPVDPVDTTGAGDTFAGVLAALLDQGETFPTALQYAAVAGSLACTREGAQPSFPRRAEIDEALGSLPSFP